MLIAETCCDSRMQVLQYFLSVAACADSMMPQPQRLQSPINNNNNNNNNNTFVECHSAIPSEALTFKTWHTSAPAYLSQHIRACSGTRSLQSSAVPFLDVPFRRTDIGKRSFSCTAPATWNYLPPAVVNCDTFSVFKSRLKTHLYDTADS